MDEAVLVTLETLDELELGVNIVDRGLVYDARSEGAAVDVRLTATNPCCPLGESLQEEAHERLAQACPESKVDVQLVWAPAWQPEHISRAVRAELLL